MAEADSLLQQGIQFHQAGELNAAERHYSQVIEIEPDHDTARYLLATLWLQQGNAGEAKEAFQALLSRLPNMPDLHNNLGVAQKALGQFDAGLESFQNALNLAPKNQQALFNIAVMCEETGQAVRAEQYYLKLVQLNHDDVQIHYRLGNLQAAQQKWTQAVKHLQQVLEQQPDNLDVQVNLAYVYSRQGLWDLASDLYTKIIQVKPDYHEVLNSLSYVKERQGDYTTAEQLSRRAIQLSPQFAEAHNNLGIALRSQHKFAESLEAFTQAISLSASFSLAEFNLGTTKLLLEQYPEGWSGYSKYLELEEAGPANSDAPLWDGKPVRGQRLLVYTDQGFGDALQFARFLPRIKAISEARLLFVTRPALLDLFANLSGPDQVISDETPWPEHDLQIPLAMTPAILRVTKSELTGSTPYLQSSKPVSDEIESFLESANQNDQKVALVWQGNPQQGRDQERSVPLQLLLPLAQHDNIRWFSLQFGETGRKQLMELRSRWPIQDLSQNIHNFADTAAALKQMDLLITVDTAIAHLAGALGIPAWVMLQFTPDWRWQIASDETPWYPGLKLIRQKTPGNWSEVIEYICRELQNQ